MVTYSYERQNIIQSALKRIREGDSIKEYFMGDSAVKYYVCRIHLLKVHYLDYNQSILSKYIHTYHSRFIPVGVAEASQIFFRDAHDEGNIIQK
jgi:hypothetical protein